MAEMVRVNVGGKAPRYLAADGERRQVLYVDVAENTRRFDEQQQRWVDGDTRWYEARFVGRDADLMRDQFEQGDALILFGEKERRVRETADGKTYRSTRFYVESFGIDPRLTTFSIDRSSRQNRTQQASRQFEQGAAADAEADIAERSAARSETASRLMAVVEGRYVSGAVADQVLGVWDDPDVPLPELGATTARVLREGGANEAVVIYVSSVADEYVGGGKALTWNEAAISAGAQEAVAAFADDPWAAVNQARQEIAGGTPPAPSM